MSKKHLTALSLAAALFSTVAVSSLSTAAFAMDDAMGGAMTSGDKMDATGDAAKTTAAKTDAMGTTTDSMSGDAMSGDKMSGDAMSGDAMAADHMSSTKSKGPK